MKNTLLSCAYEHTFIQSEYLEIDRIYNICLHIALYIFWGVNAFFILLTLKETKLVDGFTDV